MSDTSCPSQRELKGLLDGKLPSDSTVALTDHIGHCSGCQQELDHLACDDAQFSNVVRHIDQDQPPSNSAFWHALDAAGATLTSIATPKIVTGRSSGSDFDHPSGELKLDFLQPPELPEDLGKLGTFRIIKVIGRGGMGVVLHGFDPSLSRDIAVKVLDPQLAGNDTARQRFCREARAAAAVTHENLVAVHQVDEDPISGLPFLIMQLVHGESLEQRLKRVRKLNVLEVAKLGMQAAAGLAAAHAGGLIHRDIKPGNILIERDSEKVKLTDFGLARAAEDVKLTRTGFVAGTPLYMAPEQARGDDVDARADLFSLGTVLYEAAAGKPPFDGKTPLAVLRRVADEAHVPLSTENPDVPGWLSEAIDRLLEKEPAKRFQTAAEVAEIFAEELGNLHALSPLEVPSEVCALSRTNPSESRRKWQAKKYKASCVVKRFTPWAAGILIGGSAVALWNWVQPTPIASNPIHMPAFNEILKGNDDDNDGALSKAESLKTPLKDAFDSYDANKDGKVTTQEWDAMVKLLEQGKIVAVAVPAVATAELPQHEPIAIVQGGKSGPNWALDISPDNSVLATGFESGDVKFWDIHDGSPRGSLSPLEGTVWATQFSNDGNYLVTASDDGRANIWEMMTYSLVKSLPHPTSVKAAAFSPDGKKIATGDRASTIRLWDLESQIPIEKRGHRGSIHSVAFSPDGKYIASAGADRTAKIWKIGADRLDLFRSLDDHDAAVYGVAFSPDGSKVATASLDGKVRIWNAQSGALLRLILAHKADAWSVSFSHDGNLLASSSSDGTVKLWDVNTGHERLVLHGSADVPLHASRFSREGLLLGAGGRNGIARVWDVGEILKK